MDDEIAGYWGVCFMDLMGYREQLLATDIYPPSPFATPNEEEIQARFARAINRRNTLVEAPKDYVATLKQALERRAATHPGGNIRPEHLDALTFRSTGFADSVFVEKALRGRPFAMISLANVVLYGSIAMILNLSDGSPVRGGIDVAYGLSQNGVLYSAASVCAYLLEGQAKYPRMLLGKQYMDFVSRFTDDVATADEQDWVKMLATFTFEDPEDHRIGVDFLGAAFRARYLEALDPKAIRRIWTFANRSHEHFKSKKDAKLQGYYDRLKGYVEPRLSVWGLDKSTE